MSSSKNSNLTLYRGFRNSNSYVWSPFVTKVEARLRFDGVGYKIAEGSTREGPRGKVPYFDFGPRGSSSGNGEGKAAEEEEEKDLVGDSNVIVEEMVRRGVVRDLNGGLGGGEGLMDLALRGMLEEKLYFFGMKERWIDNYYVHRDKILESKPWVLRVMLGLLIHRKINQTVHLQGVGRFTPEETTVFVTEIWSTINDALEESRRKSNQKGPFWLLGKKEPTEVDATLFGFVSSALVCQSCPESQKLVKTLSAVMEYAERIHDRYFPDYEKWIL